MTKIVPRHLNEIIQYRSLDYLPFRTKLIEVFKEPDLATTYLNALASLSQTRDKTILEYMHRVRLFVLKAHSDLSHASHERILVTIFLVGLYDRQLVSSLAVVKIPTAADAERLAAEDEAVRRDQRPRRSFNNCLPEEACGEHPDDKDGYDPESEPPDDEDGYLTTALPASGTNLRINLAGRRTATATTRCYGCGQYGHFRSDCPRGRCANSARPQTRFPLECLLCKGTYRTRDCYLLSACQQLACTPQARDLEPVKAAIQSRPSVPVTLRSAALNKPNAAVKRYGIAVLHESTLADESLLLDAALPQCESSSLEGPPSPGKFPVQIINPALLAMNEESTPGTPQMQLFFVLVAVQTLPVWILADSDSV